ncbi:HAD-IIB family hydrolase [Candidatus Nomurabacteria bacterium]|nr:HAD-IIB family hydrolase [Candidatus Nomurabacteria bacterium]
MLPDKKIIAFDLDGTLAESKSPITPEMGELVKRLAKQKIVVVTSGGGFKQFKIQFLPPFHSDDSMMSLIHNLILLPTSGSQRYEYDKEKKDWKVTDKELLPESIKEKAKKLLKEIIDSGLYDIPSNPTGDIVEDRDTQITFSACGQLAPFEIKKNWDPDQKKRQKIVAALIPKLPEATLLVNASSSIDIVPKGFNKAVGLTRFINKIGLQKSDVVFIGDGLFPGGNDYSLHEAGFETIAVKGPQETINILKNWLGGQVF